MSKRKNSIYFLEISLIFLFYCRHHNSLDIDLSFVKVLSWECLELYTLTHTTPLNFWNELFMAELSNEDTFIFWHYFNVLIEDYFRFFFFLLFCRAHASNLYLTLTLLKSHVWIHTNASYFMLWYHHHLRAVFTSIANDIRIYVCM